MTVLIPAQRPAPATETIPDAAAQAGAWLTEGNAVDSQYAFGAWRHYAVPPVTPTPAPAFDPQHPLQVPDPDLPGYLA